MLPDVRVVIASDGKRGHENQSRVLARMLGDSEPLVMRLRNPEGGLSEMLLRVAYSLGGPMFTPARNAGERVRELLRPESPAEFRDFATEIGKHRSDYRVFTVSAGTPPATMNLLLARLLDAEPLCIMTPSMLPARLFKLCIVPLHDPIATQGARANVLVHPLALGFHDAASAQLQARQLAGEAGLDISVRYWTLAVGGASKSLLWNSATLREQLTAIVDQARAANARLLITTSRRTSAEATAITRELTGDLAAFFLDAATDERNPLPAFFELSEAAVVSVDSFSMVCEAIHAGFRPHLLQPGTLRGKLRRILNNLQELGLVEALSRNAQHPIHRGRGEQNFYYNQLRDEVRARLKLG